MGGKMRALEINPQQFDIELRVNDIQPETDTEYSVAQVILSLQRYVWRGLSASIRSREDRRLVHAAREGVEEKEVILVTPESGF
jgi:hypothetical protein